MVKKTYRLSAGDEQELVSYATRYRGMMTDIDEAHDEMRVYTTFADNGHPTSAAVRFPLEVVSDEPPAMPEREYRCRVCGERV